MFVDKVRITVIGGRGGDGAVAFHREKYVASGGPDGGDGGHGGSVILRVNDNLSTLLDFRYRRKYQAAAGVSGQGRKMAGKRGENLIIEVPRGTVVRDAETNQIIVDMSTGEDFILAKGGRGGWGNAHYATPTRQVPRFAKAGLKGQERDVILELKLLADVGLVGFPNVGKSTLLSVTSNAHPKIANYHFTTLYPNLGVIYVDEGVSFVMADIPGIIEGAAEGAGLGHDFLRHIDRCRLLVHVVDVSGSEGRDPVEDFHAICAELKNYSIDLSNRPMIVAANKTDLLPPDSDNLERLRAAAEEAGCELYEISAGTTVGTRNLMRAVAERLGMPHQVLDCRTPTPSTSSTTAAHGWSPASGWNGWCRTSILRTTSPGTILTSSSARWVCSPVWRKWASPTGTPWIFTTLSLSISGKASFFK